MMTRSGHTQELIKEPIGKRQHVAFPSMTSLLSGRQVHVLLTHDDQEWAHSGAHKRTNW